MIKFYDNDHTFGTLSESVHETKVTIRDADTLGAAKDYDNACCLNFASHRRPGGGYTSPRFKVAKPVKTQEEDLFRRSNLPELMDNPEVRKYYPLDETKGLYCDGIVVTKDEWLKPCTPFTISLVTVAAVVKPFTTADMMLTERKGRRIFEIAADTNQKVLILGAWGCGAFKNDPNNIAPMFKKFIDEDFKGVFEEIVFAIPGKESANYLIFEDILS